jgi:hypothetical protein
MRLRRRREADIDLDPLGIRAAAHCGRHRQYTSGCDACLPVLAAALAEFHGIGFVVVPSLSPGTAIAMPYAHRPEDR